MCMIAIVVADTTKVRIFKQITTNGKLRWQGVRLLLIPQRYEFSSKSQLLSVIYMINSVVADTTKVRIFKQITTKILFSLTIASLLLIPQRYEFSSKSQLKYITTDTWKVVADTTKVRIFKQITTTLTDTQGKALLLLIPQRYEFSSKSQRPLNWGLNSLSCC